MKAEKLWKKAFHVYLFFKWCWSFDFSIDVDEWGSRVLENKISPGVQYEQKPYIENPHSAVIPIFRGWIEYGFEPRSYFHCA